jgi:hypothetical protein
MSVPAGAHDTLVTESHLYSIAGDQFNTTNYYSGTSEQRKGDMFAFQSRSIAPWALFWEVILKSLTWTAVLFSRWS